MIVKLRGLGDEATAAILEVILREEVAHVAAGSRWFRWYCERAGVAPGPKFRELLAEYARAVLHGPFNFEARAAAGFGEDELAALRQLSGCKLNRDQVEAGASPGLAGRAHSLPTERGSAACRERVGKDE